MENLAYSPVGALRPDDFAVWRHADLAPRFDADHCRRLARFVSRLERSPRLAFAGDFLAGPSADAAAASGLYAAREAAHCLHGAPGDRGVAKEAEGGATTILQLRARAIDGY